MIYYSDKLSNALRTLLTNRTGKHVFSVGLGSQAKNPVPWRQKPNQRPDISDRIGDTECRTPQKKKYAWIFRRIGSGWSGKDAYFSSDSSMFLETCMLMAAHTSAITEMNTAIRPHNRFFFSIPWLLYHSQRYCLPHAFRRYGTCQGLLLSLPGKFVQGSIQVNRRNDQCA